MSWRRFLGVSLTLLAASAAGAAVVPIGEFTGDMYEGFEGIFPPGTYGGPIPIFNATGTMDDSMIHTIPITFSWQGPAGQVYPYNGNLFSGAIVGSVILQFSTPLTEFGGYFTTVGTIPDGTVVLRDAGGAEVGSLPMTITPLEWIWQGWSSDVPFSSVEIIGSNIPGISTLCDDFHASLVPEPAALTLVAIGAVLALGRRR